MLALKYKGKDLPNSPVANFQAIITKTKNIILLGNIKKIKNLKKKFSKEKIRFFEIDKFFEILNLLKGKNFCIDGKTCSVLNENLIHSKFSIKERN